MRVIRFIRQLIWQWQVRRWFKRYQKRHKLELAKAYKSLYRDGETTIIIPSPKRDDQG